MALQEISKPRIFHILSKISWYTLCASLWWILLLLAFSALWGVKTSITLSSIVPAIIMLNNYNQALPLILTALIVFQVTTILYTLYHINLARSNISTNVLENKYSLIATVGITHALLLVIHTTPTFTMYWLSITFYILFLAFSLYSIRFDKRMKIA